MFVPVERRGLHWLPRRKWAVYATQVQLPDADSALLWRSKDGGQTFDASPLPCDPDAEVVLQVDPEAPDVVYAAVSLIGGGILRPSFILAREGYSNP